MPVIINELEIVTDPPEAAPQESSVREAGGGEAAAPPATPFIVGEILDRRTERALRVYAH